MPKPIGMNKTMSSLSLSLIHLLRRFSLLLLVVSTSLIAAPEPSRIYHLFILDSQLGHPYDEVRSALLDELAAFGYREGDNLQVSLHSAGNDRQQGEATLREIAQEKIDVIFVGGTVATLAAKSVLLGSNQPVVFGSPTDPVGIGVIDSFDTPPKANFTGVCYPVPVKARLRFARQLMPQARTFGLIHADMPQAHSYNRWINELLAQDPEFADIRIIFRSVPLVTGEQGDQAMARFAIPHIAELDSQVDAYLKPNDQLGTRRQFAEVVAAHSNKPLIGLVKADVMQGWGATAVVFPSHQSIGRQAARMVRALLEGGEVAAIPPEWPRIYGYAVDLSKSRRFGIQVPIGILQLARENIIK